MNVIQIKITTGTSTGVVSKAVYSINGVPHIVKGTSAKGNIEPLSEYFASRIFELFIPTIRYDIKPEITFPFVKTYGYGFVSVCKIFSKELSQLYYTAKANLQKPVVDSNDIVQFVDAISLPKERLMSLLLLDAFVGNQDRHWNNIDVYFEDEVAHWAPALDFGGSLLFNMPDDELRVFEWINIGPDYSHSFQETHKKNIPIAFKLLGVKQRILKNVSLNTILDTLTEHTMNYRKEHAQSGGIDA